MICQAGSTFKRGALLDSSEACSSDLGLVSKTTLLPKAIRCCGGVVRTSVVLGTLVTNIHLDVPLLPPNAGGGC